MIIIIKKKDSEKKYKYMDLARELKKNVEHENYNWYSWYIHRRIIKGTGGHEKKRTNGDSKFNERPPANDDVKNF